MVSVESVNDIQLHNQTRTSYTHTQHFFILNPVGSVFNDWKSWK